MKTTKQASPPSETSYPANPVLLVDDDADLQRSFVFMLRDDGITNIEQCTDEREVESLLAHREFEIVVLDLNMPHISGRDLLPRIVQWNPDVPVIIVTGVDEVDTAVQCMRAGAFDYMVKPVKEDELKAAVRRAISVRDVRSENHRLKQHLLAAELSAPECFAHMVTQNRSMRAIFQYIEAIAVTPQPILITGETGTGKELIAQAIHKASKRAGEFVALNIAGVDDTAFSDTLFGHVKGAFTGALEQRGGQIERAAGGTLFLDEIGDLDGSCQVKLLRLLQEREYTPLGADIPKRTDARIVVATNKDMETLKQTKTFRDDLYYRLHAHHVHIPPLRERLDDIPLLTDHFLAVAAHELGIRKPTPPRELVTLLSAYNYPGNVREMHSLIYNAVSTHKSGILSMDTFKSIVKKGSRETQAPQAEADLMFAGGQPLPTAREAEDLLIEEALRRTDGNQKMAAELIGITRQTLIRHMKRA